MRKALQLAETVLIIAFLSLTVSVVSAETIAITGGIVHTLGKQGTLRGGTVLIHDGRVRSIGAAVDIPAEATLIDARGKVVTPGLFSAYSRLGLEEISLEPTTVDYQQRGETATASFDIATALNPRSTLVAVNRVEGITRAMVAPVSEPMEPPFVTRPLSGLGSVVNLGSIERFVTRRAAAMFVRLGAAGGATDDGSRAHALARVDQALSDAADYRQHRAAYDAGERRAYSVSKADLDALVRLLEGELPLVAEADRASDIVAAIELAKRHGIRLIIAGGAEAWLVAAKLNASAIPVIVDSLNNLPGTFDRLNATLANAARLHEAGVSIAIAEDDTHNLRNLTQAAGNAVANGLPWIDGLRAISTVPAEIFGLDKQLGTIDVGKIADIVVWDGDPLEVTTFADVVIIDGRQIVMSSRQRLLRDRYLHDDDNWPPAYRVPDLR